LRRKTRKPKKEKAETNTATNTNAATPLVFETPSSLFFGKNCAKETPKLPVLLLLLLLLLLLVLVPVAALSKKAPLRWHLLWERQLKLLLRSLLR